MEGVILKPDKVLKPSRRYLPSLFSHQENPGGGGAFPQQGACYLETSFRDNIILLRAFIWERFLFHPEFLRLALEPSLPQWMPTGQTPAPLGCAELSRAEPVHCLASSSSHSSCNSASVVPDRCLYERYIFLPEWPYVCVIIGVLRDDRTKANILIQRPPDACGGSGLNDG